MDAINENAVVDGNYILVSGRFEGWRICELTPSDLVFEATRGCCNGEERSKLRAYLRSLRERRGGRR
jgi:hypothetical protein